jgi:hypothetical protein
MIESTEKFMNNNNVELIHVITKPEIVKCIDNETCPENERFGCVNYTNNIFDKINKK